MNQYVCGGECVGIGVGNNVSVPLHMSLDFTTWHVGQKPLIETKIRNSVKSL